MSDVKHTHTAGPWKVAASVENDFVGVFPDTRELEFPICKMPPFIKRDVNEANARLIAAAPEMLEALRLVGMSAGWQYMTFETRSLIEAVIAKASGEQP